VTTTDVATVEPTADTDLVREDDERCYVYRPASTHWWGALRSVFDARGNCNGRAGFGIEFDCMQCGRRPARLCEKHWEMARNGELFLCRRCGEVLVPVWFD
jgi:hypothetical protein